MDMNPSIALSGTPLVVSARNGMFDAISLIISRWMRSIFLLGSAKMRSMMRNMRRPSQQIPISRTVESMVKGVMGFGSGSGLP